MVRLLIPVLIAAGLASAAAADPIQLITQPLLLDPSDPAHTRVGQLEFLGGLRITSPEPRFGGLSDLWVSADGNRLLAISDHGAWISANIAWAAGAPIGLGGGELTPMRDAKGNPLAPPFADAEAMVATAAGRIVTFEREHRLWLYPGEWPFAAAPQPLPAPADVAKAPANGGLEAAVALADGRLVLFAEQLKAPGGLAAWVQNGEGAFGALTFVPGAGFAPTSAALLPSGDILVLERRFSLFERDARIVRVLARDIVPGAQIAGEELATISAPLTLDNMEGIAVIPAGNGAVLVFVISDDNFSVLERTLLMVFRLDA